MIKIRKAVNQWSLLPSIRPAGRIYMVNTLPSPRFDPIMEVAAAWILFS